MDTTSPTVPWGEFAFFIKLTPTTTGPHDYCIDCIRSLLLMGARTEGLTIL